jgi:hypothetical protein
VVDFSKELSMLEKSYLKIVVQLESIQSTYQIKHQDKMMIGELRILKRSYFSKLHDDEQNGI